MKYVWLAPHMLRVAAKTPEASRAYRRAVPPEHLFSERGQVLAFLAGWTDEARRLAATR